jgi:hypothetical protein
VGGFTSFVAYRPTTTKNRTHSLNHFCHFLIFFKSVCKRWKKMKRVYAPMISFSFSFFSGDPPPSRSALSLELNGTRER